MDGGQATDSLAPGTVLDGRYRIEGEIARGGMGIIYRATHLTLDLPRAVKLITPQFARDHRYLERFRIEATAAARIEHPNVVAVHDFGEVDGAPYLVMQYVEGVDLERLVARDGPLEPRRALGLLAQVADGLAAAHAMGVVHRDVKPGNILVVGDPGPERALLTDFGLAKQLTAGPAAGQSELFGGTLEYAAPEQLAGNAVDPRTDVFSLACVLLFMVTGRTRGIGHLWGRSEATPIPPEVEQVIARARSGDPASRYATPQEFTRAVFAASKRTSPTPRAPSRDVAPAATTAGETRLRPRPVRPAPPAPAPGPAGPAGRARARARPVGAPARVVDRARRRAAARARRHRRRARRERPLGSAPHAGADAGTDARADRDPVDGRDAVAGADRDPDRRALRDAGAGDGPGARRRGRGAAPLAAARVRPLRGRLRPLRARAPALRQGPRPLDRGHAPGRPVRRRGRRRAGDPLARRGDRARRAPADPRAAQRLPRLGGHVRAAQDLGRVADLEGGPDQPQVLSRAWVARGLALAVAGFAGGFLAFTALDAGPPAPPRAATPAPSSPPPPAAAPAPRAAAS